MFEIFCKNTLKVKISLFSTENVCYEKNKADCSWICNVFS